MENNIPNIINLEDFVKCEKDDQYGYMNKEGKLVIDYKYYYASDFSNGLALVYKDKENFEFINNNGKTILVKLIFDRDKIILSLFFACQALAFQIKSEAYF